MAKRKKRNWMAKAFGKHPGKLHRKLGVPEGKKISASKMAEAKHSSDPTERKEAALAGIGKRFGGGRHKKRHGRRSSRA